MMVAGKENEEDLSFSPSSFQLVPGAEKKRSSAQERVEERSRVNGEREGGEKKKKKKGQKKRRRPGQMALVAVFLELSNIAAGGG